MAPRGWFKRYREILDGFGFDQDDDSRSARLLDGIISETSTGELHDIINGRTVLAIGAGPSLDDGIETIKHLNDTPKIAADSAVSALLDHGIKPEIVVTDLDGNLEDLQKASEHAIMVVHAHGDNADRLQSAAGFARCVGTTQGAPTGNIHNFGGFTDGDRSVFLADHFGAQNIILFGMDFGDIIGRHSQTSDEHKDIKLKKLRYGEDILSWMAEWSGAGLFTTSRPIRGFEAITYGRAGEIAEMPFNPQGCV